MLRFIRLGVPVTVVALGVVASATLSFGNAKIAKETGVKPCTVCHTTMGKKELNKLGYCYKTKKDLRACEIPAPAPAK